MIGKGLGGERQDMSAAIIRIRYALEEAGRLQPVKQANERNWPDVENLSEGGLVGPFVLRQLYEDGASPESHAWEVGAQRAVVATASQPGCLEQQPHNHIWIIRAGIILGPRRRLRGRGLLHQPADGRFVRPVSKHEQLHDRFGQELIKRRLGGSADSRRANRGCAAVLRTPVPIRVAPCSVGHYSITTE